jgi:cytochrome P450
MPTISPPAPIGEATTGEVPHPIQDWVEFMAFAGAQGPLFSFTVAGEPWVWVNDSELAIAILKLPFDKVGVGPLIEGFEESGGIGNALTANYSPTWRPRRVLLQRPLSYRNVRGFGDVFAGRVTHMLAGWRDGDVIDLQVEMSELTLAILAETMFSGDLSTAIETIERFNQARNEAFTRRAVDPTWTPGTDAGFQDALAALDAFIFGMIAARQTESEPKDILGMLVHAVDRAEAQLDDRAVRDETVGLIYAGHTTTANTLTFALALLALHPEITRELRAQVVAAVGDQMPTTAELDEKIPLAREVIEETMRLYPVGDVIDRRARADLELGDYFIPAGTALVFSAWLPQHDERYFPDPERFDPSRFSAARRKETVPWSYFPFSDGPKICLGNHLSLLEASFAVAAIARRFDLELERPEGPPVAHDFLLQPKEPILAQLRAAGPLDRRVSADS